jgi:hypothetical protein
MCDMHVTMNFGVEKRIPDCGDCLALLKRTAKRKVAKKC